jgi:hypothetical protein
MNLLATILIAAILCALAREKANPHVTSGLNHRGAANRNTVWTVLSRLELITRADKLRGSEAVLCIGARTPERPLIMAKQKVVAVPLHVVQEIHTTIRSAKEAIGALHALGDRLLQVAPGEQDEYAHSIDWGLRTLANHAACKLHDDLENLKATIQERKLA